MPVFVFILVWDPGVACCMLCSAVLLGELLVGGCLDEGVGRLGAEHGWIQALGVDIGGEVQSILTVIILRCMLCALT